MRHWKILDRGGVPDPSPEIDYGCMGCGRESRLPVVGLAMAQVEDTLIFDRGDNRVPLEIQCPHCRRRYTSDKAYVR